MGGGRSKRPRAYNWRLMWEEAKSLAEFADYSDNVDLARLVTANCLFQVSWFTESYVFEV